MAYELRKRYTTRQIVHILGLSKRYAIESGVCSKFLFRKTAFCSVLITLVEHDLALILKGKVAFCSNVLRIFLDRGDFGKNLQGVEA